MRKKNHFLFILIIAFFACCTDSSYKELYGTYIRDVGPGVNYSKIIFYPDNTYFSHSASCFSSNRDSGSFTLNNGTINITSYNRGKDAITIAKKTYYMRGDKLVFQQGKLMYIITQINPRLFLKKTRQYAGDFMLHDTLFWIKEAKKQ